MIIKFRSANDGLNMRFSHATQLTCNPEECKTQQHYKEECDINTIVARFGLTGEVPQGYKAPMSGDFTGVNDFHTAMNAVKEAEASFMQLPAHLRKRFGGDPQELMRFLDDGKNRDEAVKLGLVPPKPERTRDVVQAVDELAETVERWTRVARRDQMRRVRAATPSAGGGEPDASPPPELRAVPETMVETKDELRRRLMRGLR